MARINVEESLWSDPRFIRLCIKVGDEMKALGMVVMAWKLADKYWVPLRRPIPITVWNEAQLGTDLLDVGLAALDGGDFVYIKGCEEAFEWRFKKRESGSKGGTKKSSNQKKSQIGSKKAPVETIEENFKHHLAPPSTTQQNVASSSSSSSFSNTDKESINSNEFIGEPSASSQLILSDIETITPNHMDLKKKIAAQGRSDPKQRANQFVAAYVKAYQSRFPGGRPEDLNDGKVRGQILIWVKHYPLERACELIQAYFQMDTKWFGTKGYDFLTFRNNLSKIGQALDSGHDPDGDRVDFVSMLKGKSS